MREKILLNKIEKSYIKGDKAKCIELLNNYFKKRYDLKRLLTSGIQYTFLLENVRALADCIQEFYSEEEISIFKEVGLTEFIQKLLDNNWGGINKSALLRYVPELINYDNLKGIPYNNLHDLYEQHDKSDILDRFKDDVNDKMSFDLYKKRKGNLNQAIKEIIFTKFYESREYVAYFNALENEEDKRLFRNLILSRTDFDSVQRAYEIFLITEDSLLLEHVKKYDTGAYIYYLLIGKVKFSTEEYKELVELLNNCKDEQYRLFFAAYSYSGNPSKLASMMFTSIAGLTLFFDTLENKCTNDFEFAKIKALYSPALEHEKMILGQKLGSIDINEGFYFDRYEDSKKSIEEIYSNCQKVHVKKEQGE